MTKCFQATTLAGLLILGGCGQKSVPQSETSNSLNPSIAAVVGGGVITVDELQKEARKTPTKTQQAILEDLIAKELLFQQARQSGFETNQAFQAAYKNFLISHFRTSLDSATEAPIPEKEIEVRYKAQPEKYLTATKAHAALIYIPWTDRANDEEKALAIKQMEAVRGAVQQSTKPVETFALLAAKHSRDPGSRFRGGDIGWVQPESSGSLFPTGVLSHLFELHLDGEMSPVLESEKGCYLVKLISRQAAQVIPLAEVRAEIANELRLENQETKRNELMARIKAAIPVQINAAVLAANGQQILAAQPPPSLPGK